MDHWRFDPATAKPGDDVYIAQRYGWSSRQVARWTVARVTPSGQVVCKRGEAELRINKRGNIAGDDYRSIVSREEALAIQTEHRRNEAWLQVRAAGEGLAKAARSNDVEAARQALVNAASGIEAATADETQSGSAEGESPTGEAGDAQGQSE